MRRRIAGLTILLWVVSLGATQRPTNSESRDIQSTVRPGVRTGVNRPQAYQIGTGSWYGSDFQDKPTASGEPYNMYDLTAAHPTLPLGSYVRVTNLRNGRAVVVRINDRGPIVPGRIIDLSYNTARVLHFDSKGLQRVRLDVVNNRTTKTAQPQMMAALQY